MALSEYFDRIYHHSPVHYLPDIVRARALLSKDRLLLAGFRDDHFRSTSRKQDIERGFRSRVHLTPSLEPRLLRAKLKRGFPHITISIPVSAVMEIEHELCRYNVAKTRLLRRLASVGALESGTNGRYYDNLQIPVARTKSDQSAMLQKYAPSGAMLEVLVKDSLQLPKNTTIISYDKQDTGIVEEVLEKLGSPWGSERIDNSSYLRSDKHAADVTEYVRLSLTNKHFVRELEFDRI